MTACVVAVAMLPAGVWLAVLGWRRANPALARVGVGFTVMAMAQVDRPMSHTGWPADPRLALAALRVLGVGLVLLGMAQLT